MFKAFQREPTFKQYSSEVFKEKLGKFYQFINDFTYIDEELNPEERQQLLQSRFTNGYTPFLQLVRTLFGNDVQTQDIKAVFRKIATSPDAEVDWGELFGINTTVTEDLHEIAQPNQTLDIFTLDSKIIAGQAGGDRRSRENIKCITYSTELNIFVTVTLHGIACHWNSKFRFKSSIDIGESSWVTGCCILPDLRRIAISTERSIVIWNYRAKGKERNVFHIKPIDSPQCVTRVPWKHNPGTEDYLIYGDEQGHISLMTLNCKDFQKVGKVEKDHGDTNNVIDPTELTREIVRRKFHNDWILQLKYIPQLQMFGSCSSDKECSFVLSRLDNIMDTRPVREMSLHKGVNCFVYCVRANAIVTGGVDKILRIWHPIIMSRPTGKLIGHLFTVTDIACNERDQHLISLSTARIFRIWDLQKMQGLQTFAVGENLTAENRTCVMQFDSKYDRLITGTNIIELWPVNRDQDSQIVPHTHEQSISCMLYNAVLNQVVSACIECILKVWEIETGELVYTITQAHGSKSTFITAMVTDDTGHRLITAGQDGSLRLWDCISSRLLKSYNTEVSKMSKICNVAYIGHNETKLIIAGTANRSVRVFQDAADTIIELYALCDTVHINVEQIRLGNTPQKTPADDRKTSYDKHLLGGDLKRQSSFLSNVFLSSDVTCMDYSADDNLTAAGFSNGSVFVWNMDDNSLVSKIQKQQLFQSSSNTGGWTSDSISFLKFLVHEIEPDELKDRSETNSAATLRKNSVMENKDDGCSALAKERVASETDAVVLSVQGSHPAYLVSSGKTRESDALPATNFDARRMKHMTLLVVCSENGSVTLTTIEGKVLMQITVANAIQRTRCVTAVLEVREDMQIYSGDTMGYLSCWNLSDFWKITTDAVKVGDADRDVLPNHERQLEESIEQLLTWRAHQMKITNIEYIRDYDIVLSASIDGSVRMWHCKTGHFLGFFGQSKPWHLSDEMLIPPSPVQPHDITETPLKPLKKLRLTNINTKPEAAKCPLAFDVQRWSNVPTLPAITEKESPRDKKFFSSLSKPKHYNSHLESSSVTATYGSNSVFRTLPVYKVQSPKRLKTPSVKFRESTWYKNRTKTTTQNKRKRNAAAFRMPSPKKEVRPVVRFPHIVTGFKNGGGS
ncbi:WD repeat-containing protein 64-like [Rhopilema esculentum]|uniref:WD repeat-containing protein 64-like n=1 Tax=Rhopilema esculentum TaxID=499914 RepID=UPI0031D7B4A7